MEQNVFRFTEHFGSDRRLIGRMHFSSVAIRLGCTASVIFVRGNKLYIGHVGDSSIVLGEGESLYQTWKGHRITRDHKPEDPSELKRIRESGGNVLCKGGVHRVVWNRQKFLHSSTNGTRHDQTKTTLEYEQIPFLAISRALGDLWSFNRETNLYSVSPEPELTVIEIDPNKHRCLILASDGLWNMITPEVAVEIVRNCDVKTEEMILKSDVRSSTLLSLEERRLRFLLV